MPKPALEPRILIVDDNETIGRLLKEFIEILFKGQCKVCFPRTSAAMAKAAQNEVFDSVLVDADLSNWRQPRIFEQRFSDGIEFAKLYCDLQPKTLIVILGANTLPGREDRIRQRVANLSSCNVTEIKSPLPSDRDMVEKALQVLRPDIKQEIEEEVPRIEAIHEENPAFQPTNAFVGLHREERRLRNRLLYRRACEWMGRLMNSNLHDKGNASWTMVCDGNVQQDYYGDPLNGCRPSPEVRIRNRYPLPEEREKMARASKTNPFIFWNTGSTSILTKQFAANRLEKIIPANLGEEFGIAVASACAKAYNEGEQDNVINWCSTLARVSGFAQLDTLKAIYTSLNGDRERSVSAFANRCQEAGMIRVVDIYTATVEEIKPRKNTAVIELRNLSGDDAFVAPFDFGNLVQKGIKEIGQEFEYTVYADNLGNASGQIELIE